VVLALLCGLGGGNFASSMSNINYFYPISKKGVALGLNAGLGNLGVSATQFLVPLVIGMDLFGGFVGDYQMSVNKAGVGTQAWLQNAGFVWVPLLVITVIAAWFGMNNLEGAKASFAEQAIIFKRKHNYIMCWLYLGTFGSFIGYSAGFPLLIKTQFSGVDPLKYAFLGPLVGALARPIGGWISDKLGGARVTFWNFLAMIIAVFGVLHYLGDPSSPGAFTGFLTCFMLLFLTTGIGNASTFKMIPVIFLNERMKEHEGEGEAGNQEAIRSAAKESSAILGFSSAIGAYGAFLIPNAYGLSVTHTGGPSAALYGFAAFYVTCLLVTWWYYSRDGAEAPC
jgi:NNP family nitrate/nitrite transporter-like MFS transporter